MNSHSNRRRFLSQVGLAGAGIAASSGFALPSYSLTSGRTAKAGRKMWVKLPARSYTVVHPAV